MLVGFLLSPATPDGKGPDEPVWRQAKQRQRETATMYEQILIGGLDTATPVPRGYRRLQRRHDVEAEPQSFTSALMHLQESYGIEWRDLYYSREDSGLLEGEGHEKVHHYRALVNPAWEGKPAAELPKGRNDAIWHIPTKQYTKADPMTLWRPLEEALRDRFDVWDHGDAGDLFGVIRVRRDGGEIHMDLFSENVRVSHDAEQITLGISTGHDYFGNTRLYVDVVGYHDPGDGVGQVMRYLVDPKRRKHTGAADEEVVAWYAEGIARLETVCDTLYSIVTDAMHHEIPLRDMPTSIPGFYEHLGLPNRGDSTLAEPAGTRAVETAAGPYTAWHLYKAGMWAIEHHYPSRDTSSFKKHVSKVNTLMFNPSLAERQVLKSIEDVLTDAHETDHEVFDFVDADERSDTLEAVRTRATSISEGVSEFESTRDRLQTMLTDDGVVEAVDADADAATDESAE